MPADPSDSSLAVAGVIGHLDPEDRSELAPGIQPVWIPTFVLEFHIGQSNQPSGLYVGSGGPLSEAPVTRCA